MVTTAMLTRAILIVPNMGNQMLYVLCVAGYKEQLVRTYYIFCVQNHKINQILILNSIMLLNLFVICIREAFNKKNHFLIDIRQ